MVGRFEYMCFFCFESIKYICLKCMNYFCMWCFVFENDENVVGWKVGSLVVYCELCFEEKMIKEMNYKDVGYEEVF